MLPFMFLVVQDQVLALATRCPCLFAGEVHCLILRVLMFSFKTNPAKQSALLWLRPRNFSVKLVSCIEQALVI